MAEEQDRKEGIRKLLGVLNSIAESKAFEEYNLPLIEAFKYVFLSRKEENEFLILELNKKDEELSRRLSDMTRAAEREVQDITTGAENIKKRIDDLRALGRVVADLIARINDESAKSKDETLAKLEAIQEKYDREFAATEKIKDPEERKKEQERIKRRRIKVDRAVIRERRKLALMGKDVDAARELREKLKEKMQELAGKLGEDYKVISDLTREKYDKALHFASERFEIYKEIIRRCLIEGKVVKELWEGYSELLLPTVQDNYEIAEKQTRELNRIIAVVNREGSVKFEVPDRKMQPDSALAEAVKNLNKNFDMLTFENVLYMGWQLLLLPGASLKKSEIKKALEEMRKFDALSASKSGSANIPGETLAFMNRILKSWQEDIGVAGSPGQNTGFITEVLENVYTKNMEELTQLRANLTRGNTSGAKKSEIGEAISTVDETISLIAKYRQGLGPLKLHEKEFSGLAKQMRLTIKREGKIQVTTNLFADIIKRRSLYDNGLSDVLKEQIKNQKSIISRKLQIYEYLLCKHLVPPERLAGFYQSYFHYVLASKSRRKKLAKDLTNVLNDKLEKCKCKLLTLQMPKIPALLEERRKREEEAKKKAGKEAEKEKSRTEEEAADAKEAEKTVEEILGPEEESPEASEEEAGSGEMKGKAAAIRAELERTKKEVEDILREFREKSEEERIRRFEWYVVKADNRIRYLMRIALSVESEEKDGALKRALLEEISEICADLCILTVESLEAVRKLAVDRRNIRAALEISAVSMHFLEKLLKIVGENGKKLSEQVERIIRIRGKLEEKLKQIAPETAGEEGLDNTLWNAFRGIKYGSQVVEMLRLWEKYSYGRKVDKIRREADKLRESTDVYLNEMIENLERYSKGYPLPDMRTDELRILETAAHLMIKEAKDKVSPSKDLVLLLSHLFGMRAEEYSNLKNRILGIIEKDVMRKENSELSSLANVVTGHEGVCRRWQSNALQFWNRIREAEKKIRDLCVQSERINREITENAGENFERFEELENERRKVLDAFFKYCDWYVKAVRPYIAAYMRALESQAEKRIDAYALLATYYELFGNQEELNSLGSLWTAYSQFLHPIEEINWAVAFKSGEKLKEKIREQTDGRAPFKLDAFSIPPNFRERARKILEDPKINIDKAFELFEQWVKENR
ncbi:hypothetical protein D6764_00130 [Candidatus Woesearchaeota archaeon]|nr:MAG: hypothetical protein D6764_00130 [Candidatus Woesearchaeota archaeon]